MKRHRTRPAKLVKKAAKRRAGSSQPATHESAPIQRNPNSAIRYSPQVGLPVNEKLRRFADEVFGALELAPSGAKK
jgi:hypothetical protein